MDKIHCDFCDKIISKEPWHNQWFKLRYILEPVGWDIKNIDIYKEGDLFNKLNEFYKEKNNFDFLKTNE